VQRPQRIFERRALEQQPRHGGHDAAAAAAAAVATVAGRVHVHAVADGRRTAAPGQLRRPADRGHGGDPTQGRPGRQGPHAAGPVHQAHERVAQLVHGTSGRPEPARLGARLEDDAAQRRGAGAPAPGQGCSVALSPVPTSAAAAATATKSDQLSATPTAVVVVVQRRRRGGGRCQSVCRPVAEPLDHTHAPQRRQAVPAAPAAVVRPIIRFRPSFLNYVRNAIRKHYGCSRGI